MKKIIDYLPIATVITIAFGYLNIHFYFSQFGINIYPYLDTTEIIFSFTPIIFSLSLLTVAAIFFGVFQDLFSKQTDIEIIGKAKSRIKNPPSFIKKCLLPALACILFSSFAIYLMHLTFFSYYPEIVFDLYLFAGVVMPLGIVPHFLLERAFTIYGSRVYTNIIEGKYGAEKYEKVNSIFWTIFIVPMVLSFILSLYIRNEVKNKNLMAGNYSINGTNLYDAHLTLNDGRNVKTTNNFVYIGSTRNYFFFYNKNAERTVIIPTNQIAEIRLNEIKAKPKFLK